MKRFLTTVIALVVLAGLTDLSAKDNRRSDHRKSDNNQERPIHSFADGLGITFGYAHSAYRTFNWATNERDTRAGLDGFDLGLTKDFTLVPEALYLQTGLVYTYLNNREKKAHNSIITVGDRTENNLSIPVKLKYEFPIIENLNMFIMAGPTFVGGLSSKIKYRASVGEENAAVTYSYYTGKVKTNSTFFDASGGFGLPSDRIRRFDVALGASLGVRFLNFFEASFGYDWGLVNKFKGEAYPDLRLRRQQLYISIGVRF